MTELHPSTLLNTAEAAALLNVTPRTIRRYAAAGTVPSTKLPGKTASYVFDRESLTVWLKEAQAVS